MPPIQSFPDPNLCDNSEGVIAIGGDLHPDSLLLAYRSGIFPWPIEGYPMTWFSPPERAILRIKNLRVSRSLIRARRKSSLVFTLDQAFREVIQACAASPRPGQVGTWITEEMIQAYCELHRLGHSHSVEAWDENELVGGIYGVDVDGAFSAESMFHRKPNASKLCLLFLLDTLSSRGLDWIDIQVMTPHLKLMGAELTHRKKFLIQLAQTRQRQLKLFDRPAVASGKE